MLRRLGEGEVPGLHKYQSQEDAGGIVLNSSMSFKNDSNETGVKFESEVKRQ